MLLRIIKTTQGLVALSISPFLVINVNISLIGLIFSSSIFQKVQQRRGMDKRMWNPFKKLRTKIGKSSRLFISILVIQDHIDSTGKPILLKGDEVFDTSPTYL